MNDNQQEISSIIQNNQQINNKNKKKSKSLSIIDILRNIKKIPLFICLKGCFNRFIKKWNHYQSKCSILVQLLLFLFPLSIILYISIFFIHFFGFERIFKFDYYYLIQKEYLNYLISDIDDVHFELGSNKMKAQIDDIDYFFFFNIYFRELMSMGLLDENVKIYPNISSNSEYLYQSYDEFQKDNLINAIYTIPKEDAEKYIDKREDILSELGKLYYLFLPIITYESFTKKIYINESFLIAYEFDNQTKEIKNNNSLYFSYPLKLNEIMKSNNFYPTNALMSPQISLKKPTHGEKFNNSFYKENWFLQQDYRYRLSASDKRPLTIDYSHFNYNYYGNLNKSNILSLQSYYYIKNTQKSYIINIIFYLNLKEIQEGYLEFSYFLLFNDSLYPVEIEKYSDNDTFLISKSSITELSLSSTINNYFHYGLIDKNYNFFKHGISFDSLILESFAEPLNFYKSTESFDNDLRHFSSLYLYAGLFQKLNHLSEKEETKQLTEFNFLNRKEIIQNVCKKIDFNSYLDFLKNMDVDCLDDNNLLYYSGVKGKEDIFNFNYNIMPSCICLPLYCLSNLKEDLDLEKINEKEFINEMKLPSKCQNSFHNMINGINTSLKDSSIKKKTISKFNDDLDKINFFGKNINQNIEDEFSIFTSLNFSQFPVINFFILSLIDNSVVKNVLLELLTEIDRIKVYYLIFECFGIFIAFLVSHILLIINILKVSKVIFDYKKILENYLLKLESESNIEQNKDKKNKQKSNLISEIIFEKGNMELSKNSLEYNLMNNNSNDNPLLNELSIIFRRYYKIKKTKFIRKEHELRHSERYRKEENELFLLLRILSVYIQKFKINITMDYNFYENSKLNLNYLKSIKKEKYGQEKLILLTQCVIYELLSTEKINYDGPITNFHFSYITNINYNNKKENNLIKNAMFSYLDKNKEDKEQKSEINGILIEGANTKDEIKIIWKDNSKILEEFENNFENDDFLKKDNIKSVIESFLINVYYKYIKKIVILSPTSSFDEKEEV